MHPLGYFASAPDGNPDAAIFDEMVSRYGDYLEKLDSEQKLALRAVAAGCIYIFKNAVDEMAYLAASISVVSLVLGLVLAPWQLQLLLLIALLVGYKGLNLPIER